MTLNHQQFPREGREFQRKGEADAFALADDEFQYVVC
jgi:hypothetical protein